MKFYVNEYEATDEKLFEVSELDVTHLLSDFVREQSYASASVREHYAKLNPQEVELNKFFEENEVLVVIHQDSERDIYFVK